VKCGEDEVTDIIKQRRGARQDCSLSPYLFNNFVDYISKDIPQAPVTGTTTIAGLYL
jgi:hypothetical protein